jgi:hypothetical protein
MKKSVKYTAIGLGILALFGTGTFVGANTDWKKNAINFAHSEFVEVANDTNDELTADVSEDINEAVQDKLGKTVEEQQAELDRLLREYYDFKLKGYTDSPEFVALEQEIENIQNDILVVFKQRIDDAFAGK